MTMRVTESGLHIPPELLKGLSEVRIRKDQDRVIIEPVLPVDPLLSLGATPVDDHVTDASVNHDSYQCRQ